MRPCDCKDAVSVQKNLTESGIRFNDDEILVQPNVVILSIGCVTIKIPMHRFKQFAEWYLLDQECPEDKGNG